MINIDEDTITQAVIARHAGLDDRRLRELMTSLVQHLHAFAREVKLTEDEWFAGIRFLTETGQICSDKRQEFILLSDTLGLSMLVTAMNHRHAPGCTEATVFGPFHVKGAPAYALGADVANGAPGKPCFVRGQVRGLGGEAVSGRAHAQGAGPSRLAAGAPALHDHRARLPPADHACLPQG